VPRRDLSIVHVRAEAVAEGFELERSAVTRWHR
jgi:hypothetical protein